MKDKQHITIKIAGSVLQLDIPPEKEELLRRIEKDVNSLYAYWLKAYKDAVTPSQVLAMVAFRFAELYYELQIKVEADNEALSNAEKVFDRILLDVK